MKRLRTILNMMMGLCAMLLLTACSSPDPEPDEKLSASPSSVTITPENTSAYFSVSSNTSWSITENTGSSWLSCTPAEGSGDKEIHVYATESNTGKTSRTAKLTIKTLSGKKTATVQVTQEPEPIDYYLDVAPTSCTIDANGGTQPITVTSNDSWTVKSNQTWCKVSKTDGSNNGSFEIQVTDKNTSDKPLEADITVKGTNSGIVKTVHVTQSIPAPYLEVTPTELSFTSSAGSDVFDISSNVSWTVSSNKSWCTVSKSSGSNDASVTVKVTENTTTSKREATITIKSGNITRTVTVTQNPSDYLEVSPTSLSFTSSSGNKNFTISSNLSWKVSSDQSWCTVNKSSGSNNATITVSVTANTSSSNRTAIITVKGGNKTETVSITQEGGKLEVSPGSLSFSSSSDSKDFTISSNVSWTVSSDKSWCTVNKSSGSNNATITVSVTANTSTSERTATITVKGGSITRTISITQGVGKLEVSPTSLPFTSSGGSKDFTISSNLSWTVSSDKSWCTVNKSSGSNNATITVSVTANTSTSERTATITVKGGSITRTISITQGESYLNVDPTSLSFESSSGNKNFSISSNLSWTVSSDKSWCTVNKSSGSNNASVTVKVTENTTTSKREATITIKGGNITRTVSITQKEGGKLEVSSNSLYFTSSGGDNYFSISSNLSWTVSSDKSWCTVNRSSGSNNATITVSVTANTSTSERTATITVKGGGITRTVSIKQGEINYLNVEPTSLSFTSSSGSKNFTISSNLTWTVSSSDKSWCKVSKSAGSNNATITVTVTENTSTTSSRSATITINSGVITETVYVTQDKKDPGDDSYLGRDDYDTDTNLNNK